MDFYDQTFTPDAPPSGEWFSHTFDTCVFQNIDFAGADLAKTNFLDCAFTDCNLANVQMGETKLNNARFITCKMTGVDFGKCSPFSFRVTFVKCQMDLTVFLDNKLKKTRFTDCLLREAHFMSCELMEAAFENCDLNDAYFSENDLAKADFSTSYNLRLNPDDNVIKKARFSLQSLPGLLEKYDIVIA